MLACITAQGDADALGAESREEISKGAVRLEVGE